MVVVVPCPETVRACTACAPGYDTGRLAMPTTAPANVSVEAATTPIPPRASALRAIPIDRLSPGPTPARRSAHSTEGTEASMKAR